MASGVKRPAEQVEPLELKKPKLEPASDQDDSTDFPSPSASPCPMSDGASTPFFPLSPKTEQNSADDENSNMSDRYTNRTDKYSNEDMEMNDSENLDGSLNLPINSFSGQTESSASALPTQVKVMPASFTDPNASSGMPCTLPPGLVGQAVMTVPDPASTVLQPPKTIYMERREKDDSWKNYLVRYYMYL